MNNDKETLQAYFNDLAQHPFGKQIRTKAMIENAIARLNQDSLIRDLVVREDRGVQVEMSSEIADNVFMVVKSIPFSGTPGYAVEFVDLNNKRVIEKNHTFHNTKEEAIMAGMIKRLGGNDTVVTAANLMIAGVPQKDCGSL